MKKFIYPSSSILEKSTKAKGEDFCFVIDKIISVMKNQKIDISFIETKRGPTITKHIFSLDNTVELTKLNRSFKNLGISVPFIDFKINAHIDSNPTISISMKNANREKVTLGDCFFSSPMSQTMFALGKNEEGDVVYEELGKLPHLLVSGTTGSGKTNFIHSLICGIMCNTCPWDVNFVIIDPKVVEFSRYNGSPHLLCNVATDINTSLWYLKWMIKEMEERYENFEKYNVNYINKYNRVRPHNQYTEIVVVIDELADLMFSDKKLEFENVITKLTSLSRAAGIYLVIGTQRPSVNVITGSIKTNIPARIALKLPSRTDSRTIIDNMGAEKLFGNGDMLYKPPTGGDLVRIQSCFVSDNDINNVLNYIKKEYENYVGQS